MAIDPWEYTCDGGRAGYSGDTSYFIGWIPINGNADDSSKPTLRESRRQRRKIKRQNKKRR